MVVHRQETAREEANCTSCYLAEVFLMHVWEVVSRRGASTFVVHLTRTAKGHSASDALAGSSEEEAPGRAAWTGHAVSCLKKAGHGHGILRRLFCFTETPLEYVYLMLEEIDGREVTLKPLKPYGSSFHKKKSPPKARRYTSGMLISLRVMIGSASRSIRLSTRQSKPVSSGEGR